MKVIHHPTGHVEVDHGPAPGPTAGPLQAGMHPPVVQPTPAPGVNGGGFGGQAPDPMASGMKGAMDQALASGGPAAKEPIQKPDATRGGNESVDSKKKPDASAGKGPPNQKTATKGAKSAPKGGTSKKTSESKPGKK